MLGYTKKGFSYLSKLVDWLFEKSEQKMESESNYSIMAECLGRLICLSGEVSQKVLDNARSPNHNRRFVVASALRFALEDENSFIESILDNFIGLIGTYLFIQSKCLEMKKSM